MLASPPFAIESAIQRLGINLKTARLRRNLSIQHVAEVTGLGPRAIGDAEKGKLTTCIGIYAALLWAYDLLSPLQELANPLNDATGQAAALSNERERARKQNKDLDNDF